MKNGINVLALRQKTPQCVRLSDRCRRIWLPAPPASLGDPLFNANKHLIKTDTGPAKGGKSLNPMKASKRRV